MLDEIAQARSECQHAPDVNLSYHVFAAWRRRGIATRAAELAVTYAADVMRASRAVIKVLDGNVASLGVARNLRARWVGTAPSDAGGTFLVFHRDLVPGGADNTVHTARQNR
jgi:RimJ/RimL family protein N-acetyltransferase